MNELTGSGTRKGESGQPWAGYDPTPRGRHWAVPASLLKELGFDAEGMSQVQMLDELNARGWIVRSDDGRPTYKQYQGRGVPYQDIWAYQPGTEGILDGTDEGIDRDVKWLDSEDESLGYPTQKPVGLLQRIIETSSNEDDVVLDRFCGCGTTIEAAHKLKRQWIGIDITHYAVTLIERRLAKLSVDKKAYSVVGRPVDLAGAIDLARRDKHQFQWWASWFLGAHTYREEKRGADRGIDGNMFFQNGPYGTGRIIISVKGGENIGVSMVRDLSGVIEREAAEMGLLVTLVEPTSAMMTEANSSGYVRKSAHGRLPRIQVVTVTDLFAGRLPTLPPMPVAVRGAAPIRRKKVSEQLELLLPFEGGAIKPKKGEFVDPRFMGFG